MGFWGYGLFENDRDLDIFVDLAEECGLTTLEKDEQAKAAHNKLKKDVETETEGSAAQMQTHDGDIMYSLFAAYCSDIKTVRDFLNEGALDKLVEIHKNDTNTLMLVGVCAMSLGCTTSDVFLETLRQQFPHCGTRGRARNQIGRALFGPGGFENGKAYDFQSRGLLQTAGEVMDGAELGMEENMW
ncbi:uncharacterized protein RCC_03227 [Ramularia collo-cygni]|uniref:Uncharacterized protein n=1 Tax=Ramularia collo-cygni TaxID=112498 RepID=A0A2D3VAE1_9PEZI|nr:uncharacterized protein RCC_03227 [Ramularia collo-cygni]CZT17393.1 uncharacterized protein RCC_03227 [Ramularia collo-cygni]